ncbi:hypothetical protein ACSU1N_02645 [Thermogladius sp. 4427co]|uniref:hypothetical protein n=1 Tax=Thermogladius sp. 4427co TaxID=3450718 RepID=UPI003F7AE9BA
MDVLYLAFNLSILSYFLGTLLKGIPIPLVSVKKLGSRLMVDGVLSAFLVFSYKALVYSIDYFSRLLGSSMDVLHAWFLVETSVLVSLYTFLKLTGLIYSKIGLGFLSSGLIAPLVNILVDALVTITVFYIAVNAIRAMAQAFIAIGILLYSVPFRITRSAGSILIALPIIFTVGAPLLPSFVAMFNMPMQVNWLNIPAVPAYFKLVDYTNNTIAYYVLNATDTAGNTLYIYPSDSNGVVNATSMDRWIPYGEQVLNFMMPGSLYTVKTNVSGSQEVFNLTVRVPNVIAVATNTFIYYYTDYIEVVNVDKGNNSLTASLRVASPAQLYLVTQEDCSVVVSVDSSTIQSPQYYFEWFGIRFKAYSVNLSPGPHVIGVIINYLTVQMPNVSVKSYVESILASESAVNYFVGSLSIVFFELIVLPIVYIFILVSATLALSRIIGGVESRISRIMVLGP